MDGKEEPRQSQSGSERPPTDWVAWFTLALVFVGAIQVFVYICQARTMRESLVLTRETLRLAQRPWLTVSGISAGEFKADDRTNFEVQMTNSGNSPALRMTIRTGFLFSDNPDDPFPKSPIYQPTNVKPSIGVVGPGMPHSVVGRFSALSTNQLSDFLSGVTRLWIYGQITYWDTFDLPDPHLTNFCFYWLPPDRGFMIGPTYNHAT